MLSFEGKVTVYPFSKFKFILSLPYYEKNANTKTYKHKPVLALLFIHTIISHISLFLLLNDTMTPCLLVPYSHLYCHSVIIQY